MRAHPHGSTSVRDQGFTLIELLVVMVIIGILAAIAIPSFLAQKDKGYQAGIKSDLKGAASAEEAYATDHNGVYIAEVFNGPNPKTGTATDVSGATTDPLAVQGMRGSVGVTVTATTSTSSNPGDTYCLVATSAESAATWYLSSKDNIPRQGSSCP